MARNGYCKGANSGHITEERQLKPKPSQRKGVSISADEWSLLLIGAWRPCVVLVDSAASHETTASLS